MSKSPYETLIESELLKKRKTQKTFKGIYEILPSMYNVLILLPFCRGELCNIDDKEMVIIQDSFQFFIHDSAFKIRNIFLLMEIGSYGDASILLRSLIETFVIYKYFALKKDGNGLEKYYEVDASKRSKLRIKDIFENVVPNYYDKYYAFLCLNTHGNPISQAVSRSNVTQGSPSSNIYNINVNMFASIYNQLLPMIVGIINLYKYIYPNNVLDTENITKEELPKIYKFVYDDIKFREQNYPEQKEMLDYYKQIIKI